MLRKLDTSEHEGNGGNYEDAGCQHQDFGKIKARKYWDFRHGYFPRVPDTHDSKTSRTRQNCVDGTEALVSGGSNSGIAFGAQMMLIYPSTQG